MVFSCVTPSGMPRLPFFPENRLRGDFGPRHSWPEQGNRLRWVSGHNGRTVKKKAHCASVHCSFWIDFVSANRTFLWGTVQIRQLASSILALGVMIQLPLQPLGYAFQLHWKMFVAVPEKKEDFLVSSSTFVFLFPFVTRRSYFNHSQKMDVDIVDETHLAQNVWKTRMCVFQGGCRRRRTNGGRGWRSGGAGGRWSSCGGASPESCTPGRPACLSGTPVTPQKTLQVARRQLPLCLGHQRHPPPHDRYSLLQ